jgi:hypothetical protein
MALPIPKGRKIIINEDGAPVVDRPMILASDITISLSSFADKPSVSFNLQYETRFTSLIKTSSIFADWLRYKFETSVEERVLLKIMTSSIIPSKGKDAEDVEPIANADAVLFIAT